MKRGKNVKRRSRRRIALMPTSTGSAASWSVRTVGDISTGNPRSLRNRTPVVAGIASWTVMASGQDIQYFWT